MGILLYGSTVLIGAGGSTLLVTSLSMVADLIGCTVVSKIVRQSDVTQNYIIHSFSVLTADFSIRIEYQIVIC